MTTIQAVWPGYIQQFTGRVPEEFWTPEEESDLGERVVVVACPCGAEPKVAQNKSTICSGECGRVFLLLGEEIRVATFDPEDLADSE